MVDKDADTGGGMRCSRYQKLWFSFSWGRATEWDELEVTDLMLSQPLMGLLGFSFTFPFITLSVPSLVVETASQMVQYW